MLTISEHNTTVNARSLLGTKAQTLQHLHPLLTHARILPLQVFTVTKWRVDADAIIAGILREWPTETLIVRSSVLAEDSSKGSQAGHFVSVMDVRGEVALRTAICTVIASYENDGCGVDEILVQPMLSPVDCAGVLFSIDPATHARYRIINFTRDNRTIAVTGGCNANTYVRFAGAPTPPPDEFAPLLAALDELETLIPDIPLDIEFAIVADTTWILQIRRLLIHEPIADAVVQQEQLVEIEQKLHTGLGKHPFLHGNRTVYGVMPDWNPAEIIGVRPRPLALSLYRELVTDAIWAYQRNNYGYKNLRSFPLMLHFHGLPYIDVRVSFNSFIPRDIGGDLADRLVDHYIERLLAAPNLHDKVEFEIVFSCYTFDLPERLSSLYESGFTTKEGKQLTDSLRSLTNRVIHNETGLWREDRARLDTLRIRREQLLASSTDPVSRVYWLLEDCKRYGTLPFAGLARAGFIAVQMLRSLVATGVLSRDDHDNFMCSLNTVSTQLSHDLGQMERSEFLKHYGHLRPGTYDILSPRYDETPELYFGTNITHKHEKTDKRAPFALTRSQMRDINHLLQTHGLEHDAVGLFEFLRAGIELREYAKFEFTRNLSDVLIIIKQTGAALGFNADDLSYCDIGTFYEMNASACNHYLLLEKSIAHGRKRHAITRSLSLPSLITSTNDVWEFERLPEEPNYVTQYRVNAEICRPDERDRLAGRIVFIPSADPGYDWLFAHPIAGLVTAYGGVNSHMAIRANELNLPAVIGAGEVMFERWAAAHRLEIDCGNRRVEIIV